jgi:hypothetical protein
MMFYVLLILINIVYVYSNNFIYLRHNYTQPQSLVTYTNCTTIGAYSNVCSNNGVCTSSQQCKCNKGYITFPSDHYPYCNYKQKSQLIAFLLEFFLGLEGGAGEFYIENKSFGITQFIHRSSSAFSLDPSHLLNLLLTSTIDASSTARSFAARSFHFLLATYFILP